MDKEALKKSLQELQNFYLMMSSMAILPPNVKPILDLLESQEREVQTLQTTKATIQKEIDDLLRQKTTTADQVERAKKGTDKQLAEINQYADSLKSKKDALHAESVSLTKEHEEAKQARELVLSQLNDQISAARRTLDELNQHIDAIRSKVK